MQQRADPNQLVAFDTTPPYSSNITYGWNNLLTDFTNSVTSVYLNNCIFYPAPANVPPIVIGNVNITPSLPFTIYQGYVLTPSMFGLTNFNNGILYAVYTISAATCTFNFHNATGGSGLYVVGDTITDTTQSIVVGIVTSVTQALGAGTITLSAVQGTVIHNNDGLTNGTVTSQVTGGNAVYGTNTYTYPIQFGDAAPIEYYMGKSLASIDLTQCGCDCNEVKVVFDQVFKPLIIANAQLGAGQNKSALNSLAIAQQNANALCYPPNIL